MGVVGRGFEILPWSTNFAQLPADQARSARSLKDNLPPLRDVHKWIPAGGQEGISVASWLDTEELLPVPVPLGL
jgi:hypothetical protein